MTEQERDVIEAAVAWRRARKKHRALEIQSEARLEEEVDGLLREREEETPPTTDPRG